MENSIGNITELLSAWDSDACIVQSDACYLHRALRTNAAYTTPIRPNTDPAFYDSLEPRIRLLTIRVIDQLRCVTVSSCGGHTDGHGLIKCGQHLDILPRDDTEQHHLSERLREAQSGIDTQRNAQLRIMNARCLSDDGTRQLLSVEIIPLQTNWQRFIYDAAKLQRQFVKRLI